MVRLLKILLPCLVLLSGGAFAEPVELPESMQKVLNAEIQDAGLLPEKTQPKITEDGEGGYHALVGGFLFYLGKEGMALRGNALESDEYREADDHDRADMRKALFESIDYSQAITFPAKDKVCHVLTVFVDASCEFCAKFHQEIPALNQAGVTVRYLAYPKDGLESEGAKMTETVWCAEDPAAAITTWWKDESLEPASCDTDPVQQHFLIGETLDFPGTPAIIYANGELSTGAFTTEELLEYLDTLPSACE